MAVLNKLRKGTVIIMEYRLGNSLRIKDRGKTRKIECPSCKTKTEFGIFTNMDTRLTAKYPLLDVKTVYFLICPKCAGVFTVDEAKGDSFMKGESCAIGNYDLKPLEAFKENEDK